VVEAGQLLGARGGLDPEVEVADFDLDKLACLEMGLCWVVYGTRVCPGGLQTTPRAEVMNLATLRSLAEPERAPAPAIPVDTSGAG
jgi:hypothetical protein